MSDIVNLEVMKPYFDKLEILESEKKIYQERHSVLQRKKVEFKEFIEETQGFSSKLLIMGIAAVAAIFFDFWVNSNTLAWLPGAFQNTNENLVYVFSIIFLIIDVSFSILASGLFAKDKVTFFRDRKIWGAMLWTMALIKSVLFLIFTSVQNTNFENETAFKIMMIAFTIFVYAILHLGGAGLFYILKSFYYWIMMEIFYNPEDKVKQIRKQNMSIDGTCTKYGLDSQEVRKYFANKNNGTY